MHTPKYIKKQLLKYNKYTSIFLENNGILRASKAERLGIPRHLIYEMLRKKILIREAEGLYRLADMEPLSNPDLIQVSLLVPKSVICLVSALYFHGLTTQIPHQIYIALPRNTKTPKIEYPPIRVFHFGERAYFAGIEEKIIDGVKVSIYNKEKTIADCFKYREKFGVEIAVEALKDYFQQPNPNLNDIMNYSNINRVEKIISPYMKTLL
jgi:predicted transcriptional regulator of viral defense system